MNINPSFIYATLNKWTCVHTWLHRDQPAYRSTDFDLKLCNYQNIRKTQILLFRDKNMRQYLDLVNPWVDHIMESQFRSHDPDPSLYSSVHYYFRSMCQLWPLQCKYTLDWNIHQNHFTCTLSTLIFTSLCS